MLNASAFPGIALSRVIGHLFTTPHSVPKLPYPKYGSPFDQAPVIHCEQVGSAVLSSVKANLAAGSSFATTRSLQLDLYHGPKHHHDLDITLARQRIGFNVIYCHSLEHLPIDLQPDVPLLYASPYAPSMRLPCTAATDCSFRTLPGGAAIP